MTAAGPTHAGEKCLTCVANVVHAQRSGRILVWTMVDTGAGNGISKHDFRRAEAPAQGTQEHQHWRCYTQRWPRTPHASMSGSYLALEGRTRSTRQNCRPLLPGVVPGPVTCPRSRSGHAAGRHAV